MSDAPCPCGSGSPLDGCCGPYLRGEKLPPTAEALMRSRYTAYVTNAIDYVVDTEEAKDTDRNATREWNKGVEWQGLTVISTDKGGPEDEEGVVEFEARYKEFHAGHGHHHDEVHKERARFRKRQGRWLYRDRVPSEPLRAAPKTGRNDPCPCGSGKKFKKCHGA